MLRNIIQIDHLDHWYGDVKAVDDVCFSVKEGEIYSLLGPNGAGKSTVIKILITLLPVQKGSVHVAGYDVATQQEEVRRSIGVVFQGETLDRDLTVWETLEFHGRIYSLPRNMRRRRIDDMIALVELEGKRDVRIRHLSGGMKRRLEIARGLMTQPKVLFLDEPTLGLDTQTRIRLWEYIRKVNEAGTTIFLTTHYMDEADQVSNWIDIIDHGKIVASGSPLKLKNELGRDVIYLETNDDEAALQIVMGMDIVKDVHHGSRGLRISINSDGTYCLPEILERLKDQGVSIAGVNLKKPSLDDVFVYHTGREIREKPNAPNTC